MFCKWCGADMPKSAIKCTRCGKKLPAKSDCGGLYDRACNALTTGKAVHVSEPIHVKNKTKKFTLPLSVLCVGFVIIISLLLGLNSGVTHLCEMPSVNESVTMESMLPEEQIAKTEEYADTDARVLTMADSGDLYGTVAESIFFDTDETVPAASLSVETEFIWQYRSADKGNWKNLDETVMILFLLLVIAVCIGVLLYLAKKIRRIDKGDGTDVKAVSRKIKEKKETVCSQVTIYEYHSAKKIKLCAFCDGENEETATHCHICGQLMK